MAIVRRVAGSVLWLLRPRPEVVDNLSRAAEGHGVGAERPVFSERFGKAAHMARHPHADLFLDTRPINAHTTARDALWADVPLITCPGETFASRVAANLLQATELGDLIVPDLASYEALAVKLATTPERLRDVRERLALGRAQGPLFDAPRFVRHLEAAYAEMWRIFEADEAPRPIAVTRIGYWGGPAA